MQKCSVFSKKKGLGEMNVKEGGWSDHEPMGMIGELRRS